MWQKIIENSKIYTLITISFFTFCAGLYHLAYWQMFGINGIAVITFSNFIKSFIYPVCTVILASIFLSIYVKSIPKVVPVKKISWSFAPLLNILIALINLAAFLYFIYENNPRQWIILPLILGSFFSIALYNSNIIPDDMPKIFREYLALFIVYIPLLSFGYGMFNGQNIFYRKEYDYCLNFGRNKDTLKYLGNTGECLIFTSMDNSRNYFVQKIDTLVLLHSKEGK